MFSFIVLLLHFIDIPFLLGHYSAKQMIVSAHGKEFRIEANQYEFFR